MRRKRDSVGRERGSDIMVRKGEAGGREGGGRGTRETPPSIQPGKSVKINSTVLVDCSAKCTVYHVSYSMFSWPQKYFDKSAEAKL